MQNTRVPTRVPAGADLAGVLRKRFWLQCRAVLAAGAERVPTGADCASRIAAYDDYSTGRAQTRVIEKPTFLFSRTG